MFWISEVWRVRTWHKWHLIIMECVFILCWQCTSSPPSSFFPQEWKPWWEKKRQESAGESWCYGLRSDHKAWRRWWNWFSDGVGLWAGWMRHREKETETITAGHKKRTGCSLFGWWRSRRGPKSESKTNTHLHVDIYNVQGYMQRTHISTQVQESMQLKYVFIYITSYNVFIFRFILLLLCSCFDLWKKNWSSTLRQR